MSDVSMHDKFGRQRKDSGNPFKFDPGFEVEGYLHYHGENFVKRFDANSYLYITKAMDNFDAAEGGSLHELLRGIDAKVLVIAFKSDWLYPAVPDQGNRQGLQTCRYRDHLLRNRFDLRA